MKLKLFLIALAFLALVITTGGQTPRTKPDPEIAKMVKEVSAKNIEATIRKLTESAESWKRKYNFLATDSPDAYKTAAEK